MPESAARRRKENAAAERRKARRWAIPPVISGGPEIGPLARRTIGCGASAPAPVGALLPLIFSGAENGQGAPAPIPSGRRTRPTCRRTSRTAGSSRERRSERPHAEVRAALAASLEAQGRYGPSFEGRFAATSG